MPRWITGSAPATSPCCCSGCATGSGPVRSAGFSGAGFPAPAGIHRRGPARRLRLRAGVPSVRGGRYPGVQPSRRRAGVLRGAHPRPPGYRPPRLRVADLRPARTRHHAGRLPRQGGHRGSRPAGQLLLQGQPDQAVLQGTPGIADRDGHLRHPVDFGIGRRVCLENWNALRAVGEHANQRLCDAEAADAQPAPDTVTFAEVTRPTTTAEGLHAPALRFGDPRVMAVLAATLRFTHLIAGFDNRSLTELVSALTGAPYTSRHATYDLRRLRRKQIIERLPGTHRYRLTPHGRAIAVLFTKTYGRVLTPGLTGLSPGLPSDLARRSPLATAWRQLDRALDQHITAGPAAENPPCYRRWSPPGRRREGTSGAWPSRTSRPTRSRRPGSPRIMSPPSP